jgi:hypothetical protein
VTQVVDAQQVTWFQVTGAGCASRLATMCGLSLSRRCFLPLGLVAYQELAAFGVELRLDNVPLASVAGDWGYYLAGTSATSAPANRSWQPSNSPNYGPAGSYVI